jgi:hypothetical protein
MLLVMLVEACGPNEGLVITAVQLAAMQLDWLRSRGEAAWHGTHGVECWVNDELRKQAKVGARDQIFRLHGSGRQLEAAERAHAADVHRPCQRRQHELLRKVWQDNGLQRHIHLNVFSVAHHREATEACAAHGSDHRLLELL